MNSIRRYIAVGFVVALVALMAGLAEPAHAACPNLTINNWSGFPLKLKLWSGGGVLTTFTVATGPNAFGPFAPAAMQSSAGANLPLNNGCTPCVQVDIAGGGTVCVALCYDPVNCVLDVNITPCSPVPPNCIP